MKEKCQSLSNVILDKITQRIIVQISYYIYMPNASSFIIPSFNMYHIFIVLLHDQLLLVPK